jgi:WD40 repeat protein
MPGPQSDDAEPFELEHLMGFSGRYHDSIQFMPDDDDTVILAMGCMVVIASLSDPHKQTLLRGHDQEVSAIAVSPCGRFLASGQKMSPSREAVQIFVWDAREYRLLHGLSGLDGDIRMLHFCPDDRFLAAAAFGERVGVWDMQDGSLASWVKSDLQGDQRILNTMTWKITEEMNTQRRTNVKKYHLFTMYSKAVRQNTLARPILIFSPSHKAILHALRHASLNCLGLGCGTVNLRSGTSVLSSSSSHQSTGRCPRPVCIASSRCVDLDRPTQSCWLEQARVK